MSSPVQLLAVAVSSFEWGVIPECPHEAEAQLAAMGLVVSNGACNALDVLSLIHSQGQRSRDLLECSLLLVDATTNNLPESAKNIAIEGVHAHNDIATHADRDIRRRLMQPAAIQAPVTAQKETAVVLSFKPRS